MKEYKTIDYYGDYWNLPIIAFDKLDGSNLRFEYSQKRGFYKFGTRSVLIDEKSEPFGFAISLFKEKYEKGLTEIFKSKQYRNFQNITCFCELICESSAFGQHDFINGKFDIILFDVFVNKQDFIEPRQFVKDFSHLGIPKIVYDGNLNKEFVKNIKDNIYNLSEGVICKGVISNKKSNNLFYCKIKTDDWFNKLRGFDEKLFNQEVKQSLKT